MRRSVSAAALLASLWAASPAVTQVVPDEAPPPESAEKVALATRYAEQGGEGPYRAVMLSDPGLPTHTLYRPDNLKAVKGKLPIVAWGNGACVNVGNRFRYFLTEIASHGYLILATGPKGSQTAEWKIDITPNTVPRDPDRPPYSHAAQLNDAIDWAIAENSRKGSPYYGRLDPKKVAVMGQSCGGLQAVAAAADARVKTAVIWNSGTFPDGSRPLAGTGDASRASLKRFHGPVAWISGDESDVAWKNSNADFEQVTRVPAFRAWKKGVGHSVHYREPRGGDFTLVAVAWLDWQLKGSKVAAHMFSGADCTLCTDPKWVVKKKGIQ